MQSVVMMLNGLIHRRIPGCLVAAGTLFVLHAVNPVQVEATCGDYLLDSAGMMGRHDVMPTASLVINLPAREPEDRNPARCTGPSCQRTPLIPPPSAPDRTVIVMRDHWGTMPAAAMFIPDARCSRTAEESLLPTSAMQPRIDRPPRS